MRADHGALVVVVVVVSVVIVLLLLLVIVVVVVVVMVWLRSSSCCQCRLFYVPGCRRWLSRRCCWSSAYPCHQHSTHKHTHARTHHTHVQQQVAIYRRLPVEYIGLLTAAYPASLHQHVDSEGCVLLFCAVAAGATRLSV